MKPGLIYIVAFLYFLGLIWFEAAQQYYYITSFELAGQDEVTMIGLVQLHSIRWVIWSVLVIPLGWFVFSNPARQLTLTLVVKYVIGIGLTLVATLLAISWV